jgi:predicted secreted protein
MDLTQSPVRKTLTETGGETADFDFSYHPKVEIANYPINYRLLRPKRGVTKLNRDLKKSRESRKPGRVLTEQIGESGTNP